MQQKVEAGGSVGGEPDFGGYWVYIIPMTSEETELLSPGSYILSLRELLLLPGLGLQLYSWDNHDGHRDVSAASSSPCVMGVEEHYYDCCSPQTTWN